MKIPKEFHPVIHLRDPKSTRQNVHIAMEAGVTGVFFINHNSRENSWMDTFSALADTRRRVGDELQLGYNYLGRKPPLALIHAPDGASNCWSDTCGLHSGTFANLEAAAILQRKPDNVRFFGSFDFKYQEPVEDYRCLAHAHHIDVLVTSGPATGEPCPVDKLKRMREFWPDKPLALASGVTVENIEQYLPLVDIFLVATGISKSFHEFDADKVQALAKVIKSA